MPYDPALVDPMRKEIAQFGVEELMTAEKVEEFLGRDGSKLLFYNSVCGCAAGSARPGVALSLNHENKPDHVGTVFAGQDMEATARAREFMNDIPPSSPAAALIVEDKVAYFMARHIIEVNDPVTVSKHLTTAYDQHIN